jgi:hypothetical protein
MLVHQIDTERIFAYRAMRFARGDSQDLPGFDQDDYVAHSNAHARTLASLLAEYDATRAATLALFDSFTEEQLDLRGTANGGPPRCGPWSTSCPATSCTTSTFFASGTCPFCSGRPKLLPSLGITRRAARALNAP